MVESKGWNWSIVNNNHWDEVSEEFLPTALKWQKKNFKNFLDLGCGMGRHSIFMAELGFNVCSIDISESGLEKFREKIEGKNLNIDIKQGDMLSLPYEDTSFDCVLAFLVINHTDTEGLKKAFSEVKRVLKPGGEFYVTFNPKKDSRYFSPTSKIVDNNTVICMEEGPEYGIPHFYVDGEADIKKILDGYEIDRMTMSKFVADGENYSFHYFVRAKKL